jgi:UDP-N-acetylglucosamine 2-epimerase (non-hydrolysing)
MPEEINRIVTDSICDYFFTTTKDAGQLLLRFGIDEEKIHFVGNTMIDTLYQNVDRLKKPSFWNSYKLEKGNYFLLTLHRPSNVDSANKLKTILDAVIESSGDFPIIFPVHPRTRNILNTIETDSDRLITIEAQGYLEFIYLVKNAKGIITDSGGITEEATVLNIPCLTLRNSTERPETVEMGTNELIGDDLPKLKTSVKKIIAGNWKKATIPPLWDGHTSERIVKALLSIYEPADVMYEV